MASVAVRWPQTLILITMNNIQKTLFSLLLPFICSCTSDEQIQDISSVKETIKVTAILPRA